jgi:poly-D-alanine transfer protein DltD
VKRLVYLAMAALLALVILVPTATAQEMMDESMMMEETMMMDDSMMMEQSKMEQKMEEPKMMEKKGKMEMPKTGGPSPGLLLLPAAALLVGMGLMAGYVVRRQR